MLKRLISLLVFVALGLVPVTAPARGDEAVTEQFAVHDPASRLLVSDLDWSMFLATYVALDEASGVNLVGYPAVTALDRARLDNYLDTLQSLQITAYNRDEQLAYWLNLYNALTVNLILDHYPVESIRDISISPGLFATGPWGAPLATVEGFALSLDDIEHRILRAIWRDPRIHYGVSCASIGCPNLRREAFRGGRVDAMLDAAAREYVNDPRGVRVTEQGQLIVSSLYDWFEDDFGGSEQAVIEHLGRFAEPELAAKLAGIDRITGDFYDWGLNGTLDESLVRASDTPPVPYSMSASKILK